MSSSHKCWKNMKKSNLNGHLSLFFIHVGVMVAGDSLFAGTGLWV